VPEQVTIRIAAGLAPSAQAGTIELDSGLVQAGRFAWGVIQHEYAHEVDFFLLNDTLRATLAQRSGSFVVADSEPARPRGAYLRALCVDARLGLLALAGQRAAPGLDRCEAGGCRQGISRPAQPLAGTLTAGPAAARVRAKALAR